MLKYMSFVAGMMWGSAFAMAAEFDQIADRETLGNVGFTQLAINDAGDYVAVSKTRVFVGNTAERTIEEIDVDIDYLSFSIFDWRTETIGDQRVDFTVEIIGSRLAINNSGDFVLTSNTRLFVGNARDATMRQVMDAERFAEFQQVAINDAGHYLASSFKNVYGGLVSGESATLLVDDAPGNFAVSYSFYSFLDFDAEFGENHIALSDDGKFVAASSRAVFVGTVDEGAEMVHEDRYLGTIHAKMANSGQYAVVGYTGIFAGSL